MSAGRSRIVWLKRDLRLEDHPALAGAAAGGASVGFLHVIEPALWALGDAAERQYRAQTAALADLRAALAARGHRLLLAVGTVEDALERLHAAVGPFDLWAHQETGNTWTFSRDRRVRAWCRARQIAFAEPMTFGVQRGRIDRDGWARAWDRQMGAPVAVWPDPPPLAVPGWPDIAIPDPAALGLAHDGHDAIQLPTRAAALADLYSFLNDRGEHYRTAMSSPVPAWWGCSRLSVHLAAGTLSVREAYQATQARIAELRAMPAGARGAWLGSMTSFVGRLHWHCHFIQKLESEPALEILPAHRGFVGMRVWDDAAAARLDALAAARTGYPFVDACMRALTATGWMNFRMRAMLMSFASYDLMIPWQQSGLLFARLFTDYEPGIHWSQSQMQAGETGINTVRIYSPVKQGLDQDPDGSFTRRWVPELAHLEGAAVHEPWRASVDPARYPARIVDHAAATAAARAAISAVRRADGSREIAAAVLERHGSRRRPPVRTRGAAARAAG